MPVRAALRPVLALALLAAPAAAAAFGCAARRSQEPFQLVGMNDVERMLGQPDVAIIDANTPELFAKSHLPGARYYRSAPLADVLPKDRSTRVVFYCASPG